MTDTNASSLAAEVLHSGGESELAASSVVMEVLRSADAGVGQVTFSTVVAEVLHPKANSPALNGRRPLYVMSG